MDSDRNPWECWQGDSAGSHLTDSTGGEEEFLLSFTTPHCSVPNSDWQTPGGEPWQELELDQLISWLNRDLEDHDQRNADFRSQFQTELDGNSHASSAESWKNFSVAGDGGDGGVATTAPGPENLGVCSLLATQGPSPERNQNIAIEKLVKNSRTGRRHRGPNWSLQENRYFLQHTEVEVQKGGKPPWKAISVGLAAMGFVREAKACEDHWGVLLADLKKFETHFGSENILRDRHFWPSVGTMSREQRSQNGLPLVFDVEWFEAIARIVEERSKHRKPRRESSEGRIHVAGTPAPSSRRQQSRVCAAPATPSSETFDNPVGDGDGDGISRLVKLLGSNHRNVTIDQTIEVMRIGLEERKMDLRRQEIELERDLLYQCQRNGLKEKARRPSSRCPRMQLKRKPITPLQE